MTDDDYYTIRTGGAGEEAHRPRPLRIAALFVAGALALTIVAVPLMRDAMDEAELAQRPLDLDTRAVGSIGGPVRGAMPRGTHDDAERYVVRRSVLTGSSVCILRSDGSRSGNC